MEDFIYEIIKDFNFKPKFIKKLKYMYICETNNGTKLLKPVNISHNSLNFIYKLKEYIKNNEIFNIDTYYLSSQNLPFTVHNDETYILTDFFNIQELDLKKTEEVKKSIMAISKFHNLCKSFKFSGEIKKVNNKYIIENFEKKLSSFIKINKFLKKQKKLTDFDFLFLKNYEFFYEKCLISIEILIKNINLLEDYFMICHNDLKEENFLISEKIYLTNFENITISHNIFDLANFILRYIRKKGDNYINLDEILNIYNKFNEIKGENLPILYAILNFPERYIDTCLDFYDKKRCFTPASISNQFQDIINLKSFHQEYISKISF